MKKKKINKRQSVPYASLKKEYNSRIRQEYSDLDYIDKLDNTKKNCELPDGTMVTELEFMDFFMKEWNNAEVGKQSEAKDNKLHRTVQEVKDCTDRNNARNRDIYGIAKARNLVHKVDSESLKEITENQRTITSNYTEDALIAYLDKCKKLGKSTDNSGK